MEEAGSTRWKKKEIKKRKIKRKKKKKEITENESV